MMKTPSDRVLLVESGSSKTDWRLVSVNGVEHSFQSAGINPVAQSVSEISETQKTVLQVLVDVQISHVDFYGAGCVSDQAKSKISDFLKTTLDIVSVQVESDLVAAGKVLFGRGSGLACILGTGSNSCYFENGKVLQNVPSLGYLLGDEGSGSQIGKRLMVDYLRGDMPREVASDLRGFLGLEVSAIYDRLYLQPFPNRFLAGLIPFLAEKYGNEDYFYGVVYAELKRFFANCISKYSTEAKIKIGFVGSIAYYFRKILSDVAEVYGCEIQHVVKQPIDQLVADQHRRMAAYKE